MQYVDEEKETDAENLPREYGWFHRKGKEGEFLLSLLRKWDQQEVRKWARNTFII